VIARGPTQAIRSALLAGKRRPRIPGGSPTSRRGDGYEFVELREYVPGDDVRRIDWAASARSGQLQTRVILEGVALTLAAILDGSGSMCVGRQRALLDAGRDAVRAWYEVARSDDWCVRIDVSSPASEVRRYRAASREASQNLPGASPFNLARSLHVARTALRYGSALLVVSDFFDLSPSHDGLLQSIARRCDCTALVARDPWYDELPLAGVVRMRGAEGGSVRAFVGARERAAYAKAVRAREAALWNQFRAAGWRVGALHERDGAASLAQTFGVRHGIAI
jgi:uncharacterized protein (DUF58 family)